MFMDILSCHFTYCVPLYIERERQMYETEKQKKTKVYAEPEACYEIPNFTFNDK